jgi:hypothetical protein
VNTAARPTRSAATLDFHPTPEHWRSDSSNTTRASS